MWPLSRAGPSCSLPEDRFRAAQVGVLYLVTFIAFFVELPHLSQLLGCVASETLPLPRAPAASLSQRCHGQF